MYGGQGKKLFCPASILMTLGPPQGEHSGGVGGPPSVCSQRGSPGGCEHVILSGRSWGFCRSCSLSSLGSIIPESTQV